MVVCLDPPFFSGEKQPNKSDEADWLRNSTNIDSNQSQVSTQKLHELACSPPWPWLAGLTSSHRRMIIVKTTSYSSQNYRRRTILRSAYFRIIFCVTIKKYGHSVTVGTSVYWSFSEALCLFYDMMFTPLLCIFEVEKCIFEPNNTQNATIIYQKKWHILCHVWRWYCGFHVTCWRHRYKYCIKLSKWVFLLIFNLLLGSLFHLTHIHPDTHTWVAPIETRIRIRE